MRLYFWFSSRIWDSVRAVFFAVCFDNSVLFACANSTVKPWENWPDCRAETWSKINWFLDSPSQCRRCQSKSPKKKNWNPILARATPAVATAVSLATSLLPNLQSKLFRICPPCISQKKTRRTLEIELAPLSSFISYPNTSAVSLTNYRCEVLIRTSSIISFGETVLFLRGKSPFVSYFWLPPRDSFATYSATGEAAVSTQPKNKHRIIHFWNEGNWGAGRGGSWRCQK